MQTKTKQDYKITYKGYKMEDFIKEINSLRLNNKNNWYSLVTYIKNKRVEIKGYNTWLQIFRIDGISYPTFMGISVKDFKQTLIDGYKSI